MKKLVVTAVTLTTLLVGVVGCSKSEPVSSPTPTVSSAPVASPSPSPTAVQSFPVAPASEAAEVAAVREAWQRYQLVMGSYAKDPSQTTELGAPLYEVAAGDAVQAAAEEIGWMRSRGIKQVGDSVYRDVRIMGPSTTGGVTVAQVTACHDPSHRKMIVIKTGKEDDNPNAKKTVRSTATMELFPDKKWRVTAIESRLQTC